MNPPKNEQQWSESDHHGCRMREMSFHLFWAPLKGAAGETASGVTNSEPSRWALTSLPASPADVKTGKAVANNFVKQGNYDFLLRAMVSRGWLDAGLSR